jgi:hypothetical protein
MSEQVAPGSGGTSLSTRLDSAMGEVDGDWIVVYSKADARGLEVHILGDREFPVVALAPSVTTDVLVFLPEAIRDIVGPDTRIYVIPGDYLLKQLQGWLGRKLAPARGAARIWWPGFSTRSDSEDHPLVQRIEGESDVVALEEFARRFDLSRPRVRTEIKLIHDSRALAESERDQALARAREIEPLLRDARAACREAAARAERAEARAGSS